jgi:hypothetical protein
VRTFLVVDEFHLTVSAPRTLRGPAVRSIRRALDQPGFQAALRRAIGGVVRQYPPLKAVRITLSR